MKSSCYASVNVYSNTIMRTLVKNVHMSNQSMIYPKNATVEKYILIFWLFTRRWTSGLTGSFPAGSRAVATALIGGGGVNIQYFRVMPD